MRFPRASGILNHPTSFPSRYGIGDLGAEAYRFLDFLAAAGQRLWQIMPLGPTGYGDSPYQSFSSFAGNPLLISLGQLAAQGLLTPGDLEPVPDFPTSRVDYGPVIDYKLDRLERAFEKFSAGSASVVQSEWETFEAANADWLPDYCLFAALKETHNNANWVNWEAGIATRAPEALAYWRQALGSRIRSHSFRQFLFHRQWAALREHAHERGISIVGDVPIFVAYDSADVWAHPDLFYLDESGYPTVVAGVPPDYFSPTGQLWGNPLYRWDRLAETGYAWWIARIRKMLSMVDIIRLDHFRGFEAYWEVQATENIAMHGSWIPGPGQALFDAIEQALGPLPFIAEDLGLITPEVEELRDRLGLPGMRILQFAFDGRPANPYLPHNYRRNCVVYTGTHDNDTTIGWYNSLGELEQHLVRRYLNTSGKDIAWDMIRLALGSVADLAIVPLQDVLSLGPQARMNLPGRASGNWQWRYTPNMLTEYARDRLLDLSILFNRFQPPEPQRETAEGAEGEGAEGEGAEGEGAEGNGAQQAAKKREDRR